MNIAKYAIFLLFNYNNVITMLYIGYLYILYIFNLANCDDPVSSEGQVKRP
jgi:hypothetical protein